MSNEEIKQCSCQHFSECGVVNGGCCSHPEARVQFGKTVNLRICEICPYYDGPARGLGDRIHDIAKAVGIDKAMKVKEKITGKPCNCQKRRERLNKRFPR